MWADTRFEEELSEGDQLLVSSSGDEDWLEELGDETIKVRQRRGQEQSPAAPDLASKPRESSTLPGLRRWRGAGQREPFPPAYLQNRQAWRF